MSLTDDRGRTPVRAARTAAGRFKAGALGPRKPERGDVLRRYRAAQRTLKPRDERFAHLTQPHD